jgi:hypothetical protein
MMFCGSYAHLCQIGIIYMSWARCAHLASFAPICDTLLSGAILVLNCADLWAAFHCGLHTAASARLPGHAIAFAIASTAQCAHTLPILFVFLHSSFHPMCLCSCSIP